MNLGFSSLLVVIASSIGSYNLGRLAVPHFHQHFGNDERYTSTKNPLDHQDHEDGQGNTWDAGSNASLKPIVPETADTTTAKAAMQQSPPVPNVWKQPHKSINESSDQARLLWLQEKQRLELLVHPAMVTHEESAVVAVVSSSSSGLGLVEEVQRHKTVKRPPLVSTNYAEEQENLRALNKKKRTVDVVIIDG